MKNRPISLIILVSVFIFSLFFSLISCKNKNGDSGDQSSINEVYIPDASTYLTGQDIEEALNLGTNAVYEVRPSRSTTSSSVFYKIEDPEKSNAAVLFTVQINPVPDEITDFAASYIIDMKTTGEVTLGQEGRDIYEAFEVGGQPGAYSKKAGMFYFKDVEGYLYMIAFNVTQSEEQQYEAAIQLAEKILGK